MISYYLLSINEAIAITNQNAKCLSRILTVYHLIFGTTQLLLLLGEFILIIRFQKQLSYKYGSNICNILCDGGRDIFY